MSDVERITHQNHQRVRWAEEYKDCEERKPSKRYQSNRKRRSRRLRTASMACSMFAGMGAAFVGIGLSISNNPTVVVGIVAALVIMGAGYVFEIMAEGEGDA